MVQSNDGGAAPAVAGTLVEAGRSPEAIAAEAAAQMEAGHVFRAYDLARAGLDRHGDNEGLRVLAARALLHTGAPAEARALLEAGGAFTLDDATLGRAATLLRDLTAGDAPAGPARVAELAATLRRVADRFERATSASEDRHGLLARLYKEEWQRTGDTGALRRARDIYHTAYDLSGGFYTGINAASLSRLLGEADTAARLARCVLDQAAAERARAGAAGDAETAYWAAVTEGEALLLLDRPEAAADTYAGAANGAGATRARVASSRQQLRLLEAHGVPVPAAALAALAPPRVVIFTGHMIDEPGRTPPRFPPEMETTVARAIAERLDALDARVGYTSAAGGGDLLFIEAMLEREAEVHVVLPFDTESFIAASVTPAGRHWERRFRRALRLVDSVTLATDEPPMPDDALFSFGNEVLLGLAEMNARALGTAPDLVALWDGTSSPVPGGTADFVARWHDSDRLSVINLTALREGGAGDATVPVPGAPAAPDAAPAESGRGGRTVKCMLFADVQGFSGLTEPEMPDFLTVLDRVAADLTAHAPAAVETWGDGLFVATDGAVALADYALALAGAFARHGAGTGGPFVPRIGLHAGPVFRTPDPFTGRPGLYGVHVNRAARIEPITVPGRVFVSEPFLAFLLAEEKARRAAAACRGSGYNSPFAHHYVGTLELPKRFGVQRTYLLRRAD